MQALCTQEEQAECNLTGGREQRCLNQKLLFLKLSVHLRCPESRVGGPTGSPGSIQSPLAG